MKKITLLLAFAFISLTAVAQNLSCDDGVFLDSGGDAGTYDNNESITTVISSPDNDVVTITFTFVDIETAGNNGTQDGCWDFLTIYDGPDTSFPVLAATLCGELDGDGEIPSVDTSLLSAGDSFTSTDPSGALTIVFTSDGSVIEEGWSADITCESLSIDESAISGFKMFPNPATNELNVSASNRIQEVSVFNMLGQKVLEEQVGATSSQLNIARLQTGAYLIQVTADGQIGTYKFVKQ